MTRTRVARRFGRALLTVTVAAGLTGLAACGGDDPTGGSSPSASAGSSAGPSASGSPSPSGSPKPSAKPSENMDALTVKGDYGEKPKVNFSTPWAIKKTQSEVLEKGDGKKVKETDAVKVDYHGVNGRTGKSFDSSFQQGGQPVTFQLDQVVPGFKKGLVGKHVGDRVLMAMTGPDGAQQLAQNPQSGIEPDDTLIFVADITAATLDEAVGKKVKPKDGLPAIDTSGEKPQGSIPDSKPPKKVTVQPLIKGNGPKIGKTDMVTTKSMSWVWKDGRTADDSWGEAWTPTPPNPQTGETGQARLTAMQQAMTGHNVGSRLLVIFPPGSAYKHGDRAQGISEKDTVVMVVDILFTQPGR